jgi:hypothetical protein
MLVLWCFLLFMSIQQEATGLRIREDGCSLVDVHLFIKLSFEIPIPFMTFSKFVGSQIDWAYSWKGTWNLVAVGRKWQTQLSGTYGQDIRADMWQENVPANSHTRYSSHARAHRASLIDSGRNKLTRIIRVFASMRQWFKSQPMI